MVQAVPITLAAANPDSEVAVLNVWQYEAKTARKMVQDCIFTLLAASLSALCVPVLTHE
jgi:hypothetical protein